MTTTTSALTIECAKPNCHWRGSPADAPNHPCPTPADAPIENKTLNGEGGFGETSAGHVHDPRPSFLAERKEIEARLTAAGVSFSPDLGLDELRGLAQLLVDEPARTPEPVLGDTAAAVDTHPAVPAYDSDPETVDELGAWLAAHGQYDRNGVPSDERTASLDARYGVLVQEQPLDDHDQELVDRLDVYVPRPWQLAIHSALAEQAEVAAYKWLVVRHPADPAEEAQLIGRGKTKKEATVLAEDVKVGDGLAGRAGDIRVEKTAAVIAQAEAIQAEIEKRRELVDEPDTTVESPKPEEANHAPPAEEEAPTVETKAVAAPPTVAASPAALFDTDDYRDPTLALPQIDGHDIDRIAVTFTGEIMLDRSDKAHVALWRRLKLGHKVELWVEAKGLGYSGKGATNKDGELDVVVAKRSVVVQHLRVMGPEDLQEAALELASQARDAVEAQDARDRKPADA